MLLLSINLQFHKNKETLILEPIKIERYRVSIMIADVKTKKKNEIIRNEWFSSVCGIANGKK